MSLLNATTIHFCAAILVLLLAGIGLCFGIGWAVDSLFNSANRQIAAMPGLNKLTMYGILLMECSFIIAFITAMIIVFPAYEQLTLPIALGELGMALAVGLCALMVGCASAFSIQGACQSIARQPFFINKIQILTVTIQTLVETPVFFAFIIALLIKIKLTAQLALVDSLRLLAAGATIGFASIGPSIGQLIFTTKACMAPGLNRHAYNKIFTFTIITEALIETPLLFAFVIAILLLFKQFMVTTMIATGLLFAIVMTLTLGGMGTGAGIGFIAAKSVNEIATEPENYSNILRLSVLGQIFIESSAIFAFIVALLMFFQATNL